MNLIDHATVIKGHAEMLLTSPRLRQVEREKLLAILASVSALMDLVQRSQLLGPGVRPLQPIATRAIRPPRHRIAI